MQNTDTPFASYVCSLGTVTDHTADDLGEGYIIVQPDGITVGILANGTASPENVEADIASPRQPPPGPVALTPLTTLGRLTPAEEAALSGSTDLAVSIVRNRLIAASEIRSDDPRTAEGAAILVAKGIITEARAAEIFPL
jgi:hypothetical protein